MNNCRVGTEEWVHNLASTLLTEFRDSSLTEDQVINVITSKFNTSYNNEPNTQTIETFKDVVVNTLNKPILKLKHPWLNKYRDSKILDDLINPNKSQSTEIDKFDYGSKHDNNDETNQIIDTDTFVYSVYGYTSAALADMQLRFTTLMRDCIFFDYKTGKECISQEQFNKNIEFYLEGLWKSVCDNISNTLGIDYKSLFSSEIELNTVGNYFNGFTSEAINKLYEDSDSGSKKVMDAFQNYFIIKNFDMLIQRYYGKSIFVHDYEFKNIVTPVSADHLKYSLAGFNYNLENNWSSESEVNDVTEETSDFVKLFINSCMLLDRKNNDNPLRPLNIREVAFLWGNIKRQQYNQKEKFSKKVLDNMLKNKDITEEEYNFLTKPDKDFGFKVPKHSLYSLIQKSYEDTTFVIPLIFKLASFNEKYSLGINLQNQGDVIYSIYKQAFSEDSKLRKAWESRALSDFGSQPKSYYQYLTHFFNMQSHVIMTEYEQGDEGEFEVNTLGEASLNRHILYYQDMINGKFSALVNSHYNKKAFEQKRESFSGFILDRTKLSQDVKNSFVEVKFNDDNTILRIFPTLTTQVSFNNGRTFQNTDNIKLGENSELCEFVRYVLDLNFNNFRTQVLPNLKINNVNLLNAAATVLFNYSVSCEILNEENSKAAEEKAKKYYSSGLDKNIRTQRYTKELNSFTTNVIQNTIKDLQEKIDLLNGTLREASAKDADGHTINTMSTSQLMDKEDTNLQAIQDALENGEECVYSDLYTISQVYEGFEISRDIKTNYDENKKTVELKPSDLSAFTFVYDFASEILKADDDKTPSIMKILPCIISDKPRSLRIKVNLDKVVNGKKLKDFSKDELIQLAKQELGNFYLKVYNTIEGEWQKLNKISKENFDLIPISYSQDIKYFLDRTKEFEGIDLFSLKNNFNGINSLQDEFVEKIRNELSEETKNFLLSSYIIEETKRTGKSYDILNQEILNDVNNPETTHYQNYQNKINKYLNDRAIKATNDLIHFLINKCLESGENIEISKNYSFIQRKLNYDELYNQGIKDDNWFKKGRILLLNYSLAEELYKWGIKDKNWFNSHSNGLNSPYDSTEQFFDNKNKQWVSDFLQFGGRIGFTNKFEEVTPGILKRLSEFEGWSRNNNLVLAKINIDSNAFDIINIDSLAEVKIIQYAFELAKFYPSKDINLSEYNSVNPIESLYKWLESPEFSFEQLEKVINYYYEIQNKEIKSEKFAEKILKAKIDSVNEFVKQGKIAQGIADNIIKNFESHKNSLKDKKIEKHSTFVTVNPLIEQFNMLSYIFGQEYMNTIVGSYIQHPGKNHSDLQAFSSEQLLQQVKRNVILSATEHQFQLNELDGLPSDVKMAEIQNTSDIMYTINGEEDKVLDDDGTLYVNGVTSYYENYSLKGSAVGVDKKTIFWSQNRRTGNNKFIKCAGFPVTNQRVRNSKFWRYLNYRALKGVDKELEPYLQNGGLDITKNFLGEDANYQWFSYKRTWLGLEDQIVNYLQVSDVIVDQDGNKQYIEKSLEEVYNGEIVTITNIEFNPNGYTEFIVNGNRKQAVKLKNMHDIWLFFGGAYSMSLTENQIQGNQKIKGNEYNEESLERTAFCGNCVGKVKDGATVIRNQHQVDQYLKKSIIHYFPTTEATKCGQSNSNPKSFIYKLDLNLNYSTENLYNAGPQLNAEHESDESILSMMTQVLNALGSRGYTAYQANKVYKALRALTEVNLKPFIDSLNYSNVGNIDLAKNRMADFIVNIVKNSIKSGKISSSPETLTDLLYQQTLLTLEKNKGVLKYEDIQNTLPIDNPLLLKNIMSKLASTLVKTSIRLKFPGTMDVLSPSNGIYKLYDDRLLSYYEGTSIKDLPNKQVIDLSNLEIGRTYYCEGYYEGNTVKLNTPRDYYLLREYIQQYNVPVYEVISEGRDLASYNVKFKDLITGTWYNIWDLDVVKQSFYKEGLNDNFRNLLQQQLNSLSNYTVNNQITVNGEPIVVDKNSIKIIPYEIIMSKLYQTQFGLRIGDDVRTISEDKLFFLKRFFEETTDKSISDNEYDVKLSTIDGNYKYLITGNVPKGFKKLDFTPIQDSDGNFWYVNYRGVKTEQLSSQDDEIYSNGKVLLIKTNNITFYLDSVKHNKVELSSKIKSEENLLNILDQLDNSESEHAKFLVEKFDKFLNEGEEGLEYEVDGEERTTKIDIVKKLVNLPQAVEKFQNYINSYNYYQQKNIKTIKKILNNAEYAIDLVAKDLAPEYMQNVQIEELENVIEQVKQDLRSKYSDSEIKQMTIENLAKKNRWIKNQLNTSIDIHTSFLKSLEILAARIPAQCMQSFMSMKIVGFEESGLNVAYVSRAQIYLQGSDFDIDKVSLLGFKFRTGEFVKWSPFQDLSSYEVLKVSEELPFPTGHETIWIEGHNDRITELYNQIFNSEGFVNNQNNIRKLAQLIDIINELGGIPKENALPHLKETIDKHNLYTTKRGVKITDALMNFVSSNMFNIGKDPINQVQAQSSVDASNGCVNQIKAISKNLPYSKHLKKVDPGSQTSLSRIQSLNTGGKANTGLTASSLKVFEAFFQYVSNVLNSGTLEEKQNLLINKNICGKEVKLIANAYQQIGTELPQEIKEALETVNQDVDANLLYSGFMSLSTDNAKDPTLPKINANEAMIGLYLTGITLGLDVDSLVKLLTTDIALKISNIIPNDLFNGNDGKGRVSQVIQYIKEGPKYIIPLTQSALSFSKLFPDDFKKNPTFEGLDKLKEGKSQNEREKIQKEYEKVLENSQLSYTKKSQLNRAKKEYDAWKRLFNLAKFNSIEINGKQLNAFKEIEKLCFMLEEMQLFTRIGRLNQTLPNSIGEQINWIRNFENIINTRLRSINVNVDKVLQPLREYNESLIRKDGYNQTPSDHLLNQVDLVEFIKNKEYQDLIINTYDQLKFGINVFRVMTSVEHYYGYLETECGLHCIASSLSNIYNITNFLSKYYLQELKGNAKVKEKTFSKALDYISMSCIDEFLHEYDYLQNGSIGIVPNSKMYDVYRETSDKQLELVQANSSSNIILGTYQGNMTYKYIFEKYVIPRIKSIFPQNTLLNSLTFIKTDKTINKQVFIKLAPYTKMIPENDYDRRCLSDYKRDLEKIKNERVSEFGGISFLDALFIYDLIVNQSTVRENSLTSVFEQYIYDQNPNESELIYQYINSQKPASSKIFSKIKDFDVNDLENFLIQTAPEDNNETSHMPYIWKRNNKTKKLSLYRFNRGLSPEEANQLIDMGEDLDESSMDSGYKIVKTIDNPMIFNSLSLPSIKRQITKVSGELDNYNGVTWNEIKDLEKVKSFEVNSMTKLLIKLHLLDKEGMHFIGNISKEDFLEILKSDCG